jgi:hypothetical protein
MKLRYLLSLSLLIPTASIECGILNASTQSFRTWAPRTLVAALGAGFWFKQNQGLSSFDKHDLKPSTEFLRIYKNIAQHLSLYNDTLTLEQREDHVKTADLAKIAALAECKINSKTDASCITVLEEFNEALSKEKPTAEQSQKLAQQSMDRARGAELTRISESKAYSFSKTIGSRQNGHFLGQEESKNSSKKAEILNAACFHGECVQYKPYALGVSSVFFNKEIK